MLVVSALSSLGVVTVRQSFPQEDGRLVLSALNGPVDVLRDSYGVPNIYADNAEDLFAAQGYVHAQDRFFEMDFRRHVTSGRLAELFGPSEVETDAYIRTLGWRRVAEQELSLLSPSTRRYLDAYAAGVNAYLQSRTTAELSLEYSVLGITGPDYTPEPWTAADSVAWLKAMAWDLSSNRRQETELALMTTRVGASRAAQLFPPYDLEKFDPIVTRGAVVDGKFDPRASAGSQRTAPAGADTAHLRGADRALRAAAKAGDAIPDLLGDQALGAEVGSNSYVVSGRRTASGKPLLSNDPHLATSIPSISAQVGLHCRVVNSDCPFEVSGFSFAGMPGVIIGQNQKIAWGFTTSYLDVQDLYLEEVRDNTVRVGSNYQPLVTRTEEIKVAGEDQPRSLTVRESRHGPLLSDVDDQLRLMGERSKKPGQSGYAVALSWVALTPSRTMDSLFGLDKAQNFSQFRAAAKLLAAPSQNLVYADVEGNIGYQLPGALPQRGKGNGLLPSPGWDPAYDWKGLVDFNELPYVYNPPSGYIVTANQPIVSARYPIKLGSDYSYGWRSQEIIDRLEAAPPLTLDNAENVFYDDTIRFAADLTPRLLKIKVTDPWIKEGQQTLVGWDYSASADSNAAAYFNVVFHNILKLTFRDQLPEELWPTGGDRWFAVVASMLDQPTSSWWDDITTPQVETRDDILLAAMTQARKELTSLMARDTGAWQWGRLHRLTLVHQTLGKSGIPAVEALFNRGDYEVGGGPAVVDALAYDDRLGYRVTHGPTMRMIVDLADRDGSRWINQSGVSGHAFHRNYDDQTELWASNRMIPFVVGRAKVDAAAQHRLELVPG
nr:penicillin acylase family protein [Microlunatus panaciterrae]